MRERKSMRERAREYMCEKENIIEMRSDVKMYNRDGGKRDIYTYSYMKIEIGLK